MNHVALGASVFAGGVGGGLVRLHRHLAAATDIARILFIVFLVLFVVALIMGRGRPPAI